MEYDYEKHGFKIVRGFFNASELVEIKKFSREWGDELVDSPRELTVYSPVQQFSSFRYKSRPEEYPHATIDKLTAFMNSTSSKHQRIINSLYTEIQADTIMNKPGFSWHSDARSFLFFEPEPICRADVVWFALDNSFTDNQGNLDLILTKDVEELFQTKLEKSELVQVYTTELFKQRYNIDLTKKGKYLLFNVITSRVRGFSNNSCDTRAIRPEINPGDLLISKREIQHRTSPTQSRSGSRSACVVRYVDSDATYNGCLESGMPFSQFNSLETSELWRRMEKAKRGDKIFEGV